MERSQLPRRTLLKRGLVMIGGALGLVAAERQAGTQLAAAPSGAERGSQPGTFRLYARGWRARTPPTPLGRPDDGDHRVGYGDVTDADGRVVGRLCTNGFGTQTPFGQALPGSPTIEFQTLALNDGTLFGIGSGALNRGAAHTYAILGGTGRFAGVGGTYTARTLSADSAGRETLEFTLTLTA